MIDLQAKMALPYVSDGIRGIGGRLRARPEHFEVVEIPLYEASGEGDHLYVNITKVGLTTKQVQAGLARLFGVGQSQVGFAGLKDKNARTTQTYSVGAGALDRATVEEAQARIEQELGVTLNWARFHRNKLKTGHLLGNRFAIVVSGLEHGRGASLATCREVEGLLRTRGLPDYFGPQRFGRDGGNVEQGLGVLKGTHWRRDKWLRKFLVGSVQSHLCNVYLAERLRNGLFDRLLAGDVAKKYETGGMFDVVDINTEQTRYEAHEISFTSPLFGPKMWAAKGESGELEASVLEAASLAMDDFARVRVSGSRRLGRLLVEDLSVEAHEEGVLMRFSLPKGAYATTVMREFMKTDDEQEFSGDDNAETVEAETGETD